MLLEAPAVIDEARRHVKTRAGTNVASRLDFVAGDFLSEVPSGDALLLRWVLHNWNDDNCLRILEACARALDKKSVRRP